MQRAEGRAVAARCRHALFVEEIGVNGLDLVDLSRAHADAVVDHEAGERGAVDEHDRLPQEALSIFAGILGEASRGDEKALRYALSGKRPDECLCRGVFATPTNPRRPARIGSIPAMIKAALSQPATSAWP